MRALLSARRVLLLASIATPVKAFPLLSTCIVPRPRQNRFFMSTDSGSVASGSSGLLVSSIQHIGDDQIRLILASQSPRRREILDMMGLSGRYTATPSPLDESALQSRLAEEALLPVEYTRILAEEKANALAIALADKANAPSTLVLGSDTIVDLDNVGILEKPTSTDEAKSMLKRLSGNWHKVHTGVAIYHVKGQTVEKLSSFTDEARVKFASLSDADIDAYVATGEPMDKAGSYGIQGIGGQLVESMQGDFFTVMGLPMHRVSRALADAVDRVKRE